MASKKSIRIQQIALGVGILLLIVKFITYSITGSNAILSDALESIINVMAGMLALFSISYAAIPKDKNHPYGHGKIEFIAVGIEGGLIFFAGAVMIIKAIYHFFHPNAITELNLGIGLTFITGGINYILARLMINKGKEYQSMTLAADGRHLQSDAYTSAGLIIGLIVVKISGWEFIDNVIAMIFGAMIIIEGVKLIKNSISGILDEADFSLIEQLIDYLQQHRQAEWIDIQKFRVVKYGNSLHIDCHMVFPFYKDLKEIHDHMENIELMIEEQLDQPVEMFIHPDPCDDTFCNKCSVSDCPFRKEIGVLQTWKIKTIL